MDKFNRQLHPEEKELAKTLSMKSNGKYTAEQIEAQLRLSFVKGSDITPSNDMVAIKDGIYDPSGIGCLWATAKRLFSCPRLRTVRSSPLSRKIQALMSGRCRRKAAFSRILTGDPSAYPQGGTGKRDRLTGYALDEKSGYRVPVTIEGVVYTPRYMSCGSAECISSGANIDLTDVNTLKWIKAADVEKISDVGVALGAGAALTTGGVSVELSNGSMAVSFLSGYLKNELPEAATSNALSMGFEKFAVAKGVTPENASRLSNALGTAEAWDKLVEGLRDAIKGE